MDYEGDASVDTKTIGEVIGGTLKVYGSIFACLFTAYVVVRPWYPLVYNFTNSIREYNTKISVDHYGHIKWIWKIFRHSDDELFECCGLTAAIYIRFLRMGVKIAAVGIFNSLYLIPVNLTGCTEGDDCQFVTDRIAKIGLGNVSQGSYSLLASTVAAYVIFGSTIYFIYQEFEWFTTARHKFLCKPRPDNYTVFVAHIPKKYQSDIALQEYFKSIFHQKDVLEASIARDLHHLQHKAAKREKLVNDLEHAYNLRNAKSFEPTHLTAKGEKLQSIPTYSAELEKLNNEISDIITKIEDKKEEDKREFLEQLHLEQSHSDGDIGVDGSSRMNNFYQAFNSESEMKKLVGDDTLEQSYQSHKNTEEQMGSLLTRSSVGEDTETPNKKSKLLKIPDSAGLDKVSGVALKGAKSAFTMAASLIHGSDEDGKVRDGGFVTFTSLTAKAQCVQMIHHPEPFTFHVMDAPLPKDIFWDNVGLEHKKQQVQYLVAQVITAAICFLWVFPVSFVASLSEVDNLKALMPGLENIINDNPGFEQFLIQINPLLLVLLKVLLQVVLRKVCESEGHVSLISLNASLLAKLAVLMIIQIFFVQAIAGTFFASLEEILNDWTKVIAILGTSVPEQVKSFIQYLLVNILLSCGLEILRIVTVVKAFIRTKVGPNLTEKERNSVYMGLQPLTVPDEMDYPMAFAEILLYLTILLVYSCIAPIMSFVMLFLFMILMVTYRNQIIYIYTSENDLGGMLWEKTIKILIFCMIVAQLTLIGVLSLKQSAISSVLVVPLTPLTILFAIYLSQEHFKVTQVLPSTLCKHEDTKNFGSIDLSFLKDQYMQPALKTKELLPSNFEDVGNLEDVEEGDEDFMMECTNDAIEEVIEVDEASTL